MSKQLLLGDEAIAQAALDAGLSGVYAYPGTPSTEITEYIQMAPITSERNIHNRWCQRKDGNGSCLRYVFCWQTCISLHETCRNERSRRLFYQFGHHRCKRRTNCSSSR